jgi:hypothetical protein
MEKLVELDAKRRVALGRLERHSDIRYMARDEPDGTVVLTPAIVMPASQARFMADPGRVAALGRAVAEKHLAGPAPSWLTAELDRS